MQIRHAIAGAMLGASVFAMPALAQDAAPLPTQDAAAAPAPDMMPPPAPDVRDKDFTGPYVAFSGGYDVQGNDLGSRINFDRNGDGNFNDAVTTATGANAFAAGFCHGKARGTTPSASGGCEGDRNRGSYYARVGYDVQRGPFVLGALGEFGRTDIVDYVSGFTANNNYVFSRGIDWESSGRLRSGYSVNGGLFYATGGVGYARISHGFSTTNTANNFSTLLNDRDKFGFIVGGGVEYRIAGPFSIGLEYTYHEYKDGQYDIRATQGSASATNAFVLAPYTAGTTLTRSDNNFRWHSLRATVGFHF